MSLLIFRCENCGVEKDPLDAGSLYGPCPGMPPVPGMPGGIHTYEQVRIAEPPSQVPQGWRSPATCKADRPWCVGKRDRHRGSRSERRRLMATIHAVIVYFNQIKPLLLVLTMLCWLRRRDK